MENILVTGANGFIGSNLVKRLVENGNTVTSMVRKTSDLSFLEGIDTQIIYGDINDTGSLEKAVQGIDKVYHVAGLAADWGPYEIFDKINLQGTKNIANIAYKNNVKKLIYISTVAFHGFGKTNMTEESGVSKNLIPYSKTKYLAEKWLWEFSDETGMPVTA
ncbi:MAG TPA: NAD-dependent epimerase/dehydratase family protein, partial [Bacteroidetes bacterium]|nr:NAD-dependent epimerase/dehydratase family protein [Bacteroidota bacterium]